MSRKCASDTQVDYITGRSNHRIGIIKVKTIQIQEPMMKINQQKEPMEQESVVEIETDNETVNTENFDLSDAQSRFHRALEICTIQYRRKTTVKKPGTAVSALERGFQEELSARRVAENGWSPSTSPKSTA